MKLRSRPESPTAVPGRDTRADERVRQTLEELRELGFVVVHDIEQDGDGASEHLVSGSTGLFLITALRRHAKDEHLHESLRRAEELFRELDTWVTPVICLTSRRRGKPQRRERVWIVRRGQLLEWIAGRRNPVLEAERITELAERLHADSSETPASILVETVRTTLLGRARADQTGAENDDDATQVESEQAVSSEPGVSRLESSSRDDV